MTVILAAFNGIDLGLLSLVIAGLFWLLYQGAVRLDEYEERLDKTGPAEGGRMLTDSGRGFSYGAANQRPLVRRPGDAENQVGGARIYDQEKEDVA